MVRYIKKKSYIKKESYPLNKVFPHVLFKNRYYGKQHKVNFNGDMIDMSSERLQLFALKGVKCVVCGIEGRYFTKEKGKETKTDVYHLNLYAWDEVKQEEVLMTKDHIIPASQGGPNYLSNFQTMCAKCNYDKGIVIHDEETVESVKRENEMDPLCYIRKYLDKKLDIDLSN